MPELPEVETTVRDLRAHLVGRRIVGARVTWPRTIAHPTAEAFERAATGLRILSITRRGKFLVLSLAGPATGHVAAYLLVHLRMTGGFQFHPPEAERGKHVHVSLALDDGRELRFHDPRKFGRMWLVEDLSEVVGGLGPEPLEISRKEFDARLAARKGRLKPLLLNQSFVAGVGNIYADESLWYARLHPLREASSLRPSERAALYRAIRRVLRKGIAAGGSSLDATYRRVNGMSGRYQERFRVVGRAGEPCYRCGAAIVRTVVGQRGTHYCPSCQKLPRMRKK